MRANRILLITIATASLILGCKKKNEDFNPEQLSEYLPLKTGKYITYRLDSAVFTLQGRKDEIHSFQEKHVIDEQRPDNLGRPSYRIFRYLRDTAGNDPWAPAGTYWITPLQNTVEVIENNLRSVRLSLPINLERAWKGYSFLPNDPFSATYGDEFNNDDNMHDWDFTYESKDEQMMLNGRNVSGILTVKHMDESSNVPITDPDTYAFINYSEDKYAKGIGLVYQSLIMWEYQVIPGGPSPYKVGFGIRRSMIDHN
jgi:hypothetical protein